MHRAAWYAVAAVAVVALLSTGAHALVEAAPTGYGTAGCATGEISVFADEDASSDDVEAGYADLSARERRFVDAARTRSNHTTAVDPAVVRDLPHSVVIDGTVHRITGSTSDCPMVAGTPRWTNYVLAPLFAIYEALSPLYLPGAAVLGLGIAYRYVDDRLRFD